jgi:hypothetical protein
MRVNKGYSDINKISTTKQGLRRVTRITSMKIYSTDRLTKYINTFTCMYIYVHQQYITMFISPIIKIFISSRHSYLQMSSWQ